MASFIQTEAVRGKLDGKTVYFGRVTVWENNLPLWSQRLSVARPSRSFAEDDAKAESYRMQQETANGGDMRTGPHCHPAAR
jgi:hypothetical protein